MSKIYKKTALFAFAGLIAAPAIASADTISPAAVTATIAKGGSTTINKTVTVTKDASTTNMADIFFLADTTGSMGGAISSVITSASAILTQAASLGDVAFGVGEYKDTYDAYRYRLNTSITTNTVDAQNGINMWSAGGGSDSPEAQFYAMNEVATSISSGWRTGAERIMVWFGDYSGHDPDGGVSEAMATNALVSKGIQVEAIDLGYLNVETGGATGEGGASTSGQATRIASATGGHYYSGINSSGIVAAINNAIGTAIDTYTSVGLDLSGIPAGISASYGGPITGSFDRSVDRTFNFTVTLLGDTVGTYSFPIHGTVDGGRVATELDDITVKPTPEPASMLLFGTGLAGLAGAAKRRRTQKN